MKVSVVTQDILTRLRVPQLAVSVVGTAEELCAVVVEADVTHGLSVARVRTHTPPIVVHLPDLQTRGRYC